MSNNKIYKFECRVLSQPSNMGKRFPGAFRSRTAFHACPLLGSQAWFNKKEGLRKEWARGGGSGQALRLVSEAPLAAAGVEGATAALRASPPGVFPGYRVAILPQSTAGAGTDSGVHVELQMDRGTLDAFYPGGLEPGQACEVTVPSRNGDLQGLRSAKVWTDGSGSQKTFGMSSLSVTNLATQQRWFVDHNDEVTPDGVFLQVRIHSRSPCQHMSSGPGPCRLPCSVFPADNQRRQWRLPPQLSVRQQKLPHELPGRWVSSGSRSKTIPTSLRGGCPC